jgi:hypothetical protein
LARRLALTLLLALLLVALMPAGGHGARAAGGASLPLLSNSTPVALCYPYLITASGVINLASGQSYSPWPGDVAVNASCGEGYMAVVGEDGAYFLYMSNASVSSVVALPASDVVGIYSDLIAYNVSGSVYVEGPRGLEATLELPANFSVVSFSYVGSPVLLERAPGGAFYIQSPQGLLGLNVTSPAPSGYLNGSTAYVFGYMGGAGPYLLIYRVSGRPLSAQLLSAVPVSLVPLRVYWASGSYVMALSGAGLVLIKASLTGASYQPIGSAVPVPGGYYMPLTGYSYILYRGSWEPVPGEVVGSLGNIAFVVNYAGASALAPALPTALDLSARAQVLVNVSGLLVSLRLPPGSYEVPTPSTLYVNGTQLEALGGAVEYPPRYGAPRLTAYFVRPRALVPIETFYPVTYASSGAGAALLVVPAEAIVLTQAGSQGLPPRPVEIPGEWLFGGVGPGGVALYSANNTITVFNYAGRPVAYYRANISYVPTYMGVYVAYGGYYVMVEEETLSGCKLTIYGPGGASSLSLPWPVALDPMTGLEVTPSGLEGPGVNLTIPVDVQTASVNGLSAAFAGANGDLYIVNLSSSEEYIMITAPQGSLKFLPLWGGELLIYNETSFTAEVVSYSDMVGGEWRVNVSASPSDATIYLNGTPIGVGSAYFYDSAMPVNVTAEAPGYAPLSYVVVPLADTSVRLSLSPAFVYARLSVSSPVPVNYVEAYVNGTPLTWAVNGSVRLLSRVPYRVDVVGFYPYNVCAPVSETIALSSNATIDLSCSLTMPVLRLFSAVEASLSLTKYGVTVFSGVIGAGQEVYMPVAPGSYNITASANGMTFSALVNATRPALYSYNVTPTAPPRPTRGTIEVYTNVSDASVEVAFPNGTPVAIGVGRVAVGVAPGAYVVSARAAGYRQVNRTVSVSAGQTVNVSLGLAPVKAVRRVSVNLSYYVIGAAVAATVVAIYLGMRYYRPGQAPGGEQEV